PPPPPCLSHKPSNRLIAALFLALSFSLTTPTAFAQVTGTPSSGADTLTGDATANTIDGLAGEDTISGGEGNDTLMGGDGDDKLIGGKGDDTLQGGADNDKLNGGTGADTLNGNAGRDRLRGQAGDDILHGNDDRDRLKGGAGNDQLYGGDARDWLNGGLGDDTLEGQGGRDNLRGGPDNDSLNGGMGNDSLNGEAGTDELTGGEGTDRFLLLNPESDTDNADTITDFALDEDRLILPADTTSLWFEHLTDSGNESTALYNAADRSGTYAILDGDHFDLTDSDATLQDTAGTAIATVQEWTPPSSLGELTIADVVDNWFTPRKLHATAPNTPITTSTVAEGSVATALIGIALNLSAAPTAEATFIASLAATRDGVSQTVASFFTAGAADLAANTSTGWYWRITNSCAAINDPGWLQSGATGIEFTYPANAAAECLNGFVVQIIPPRINTSGFKDANTVPETITLTITAKSTTASTRYQLPPAHTITFTDTGS
ncbi:MAG: hypothetical protein GDA55_06960, partial [Cellvibrionales bacterium]|nr:hypothetical protein [Cellvibrionales bacterium]